ncbi:MAG: hypothetical protein ABMB14_36750, partial [Myxococcota bacterium]
LGPVPRGLGPHTTRVLSDTLRANTLAKKLVGMQLMIEPMALALFHLIRAAKVEPVLCDLLALYERDEARHVALGVLHLPKLLTGMSTAEAIDLWGWEFSAYWNQLATLRELEPQFRVLGIDVREVVRIGRQKQVRANQQLIAELGSPVPVIDLFVRFFDAKAAWDWPTGPVSSWRDRASDAWRAATRGLVDEVGVPPAVTSG